MAIDVIYTTFRTRASLVSYGVGLTLVSIVFLAFHLLKRKRISLSKPASTSISQPQTYLLQFPPSRRHALASILDIKDTNLPFELAPEFLKDHALPTTRSPDLNKDQQFTPTGFSTQDIRALGRFPDYSVLSGVRHPQPCGPKFDIKKAVFRPFRPFRWGYHQTMSLMKFDPDYWVELEQNYFKTMAARQELLKKHPDRVFFHNPGSELACRELMEMILQFACKRYPKYFSLSESKRIFYNRLLNTETNLDTTQPLQAIFNNIPEDYAIMLRNENDGLYYLRAAMVCSSVGWDIGMHRDEPLRMIHTHVPDYASKMAFSMDRYFSKMPADQPIQRCSWSLEDHAPLFSSPVVVPDWKRSSFEANKEKLTINDIKLRCDWQTLRRLPLSSAIVFNFKAVFTPITELRKEPYIPALLLRVLQEGKENLITYKTVDHVKQVTMAALEKWAQEQVADGVVPPDWEVGTLEDSPFFPGWEEKWHAQQGF